MNFYPHHIGDYRSATTHLTNEEDLAYRRLLEMYYDTEKPIPLDTKWVSRRLRVETQAIETVLDDFFIKEESGYRHARCDSEIAQYNRKANVARANGKKGGRRKAAPILANNPVGLGQVATGNQWQTQALANQEPRPINQEPLTNISTTTVVDSAPEKKTPSKKSTSIEKPDDVTDQTWADWLQLRKTKKAPVTETVLKQARSESEKAGISLEAFLQIWCARGSQGLQADWIKPSELPGRVSRPNGKPSINDFSEGGDDDPFSTMRRTL